MTRLGLATLLLATTVACERGDSSNQPEPTREPEPATAPPTTEATEPAVESPTTEATEPEPAAPASEDDVEVSEVEEALVEKDGFVARDLHCSLSTPTKRAKRYIVTGLANKDDILDACAPSGAAIQVEWSYVSGQALNASVTAENNKIAKCVTAAMAKVGAGVEASCSAILLLGDVEAATKAYEAR